MRVRIPVLLFVCVVSILVIPSGCHNDDNKTGPNPTVTPTSPPVTPTATVPPATATAPPATATPTRAAGTATPTPTSIAAGYSGTWTGPWNNTTFGTSGTGTLVDTVNTVTQTFDATFTLTGNVFGTTAPPPMHFSGSYASGSFHQNGTPIGDITINFPSPGTFVGSLQNVPNPNIARVDF